MKFIIVISIATIIGISNPMDCRSQISEIKALADGAGSIFSGCSGSDIDAGFELFNCCLNSGLYFAEFFIDHHKEIMDMRFLDPTLLSLEITPQAAYALHFEKNKTYTYINFLPQVRANLGIISTDFRFNMLTEYTNDFPNAFNSFEMLFLFNLITQKSFRFSVGSGADYEFFTENFYNEHYIQTKIFLPNHPDFFDIDGRLSCDYERGLFPFAEAGILYSSRIFNFTHLNTNLFIGGMYQNYYSAHEIWAIKGGISLNIH